MGEQQSNLTSPKYGYDFVVALTQESVNNALQTYLLNIDASSVAQYFVHQDHETQMLTLEELQALGSGLNPPVSITDPLSLPNDTPVSDPAIQALSKVNFVCAFSAEIGVPPVYGPPNQSAMPPVATFQPNNTVQFQLMCSNFTVANLSYTGGLSWLCESQGSQGAWLFTSNVALQNLEIGSTDYDHLPSPVQKQIHSLGTGQFSVQQLLFDLDNAEMESIPTISGVTAGSTLYSLLSQYFTGAYFSQMQSKGQPVLGYSLPQNSGPGGTLTPTACNFQISPCVTPGGNPVMNPSTSQAAIETLCYECATNGDTLPPAAGFAWNWIDASEASQYDGVVAINRDALTDYVNGQLQPYLSAICFKPSVHVYATDAGFKVHYSWSATPGQVPTAQTPSAPSTMLSYSYSASASSAGATLGDMTLKPSMNCTVKFQTPPEGGAQIVIARNLTMWVHVYFDTSKTSGNVINTTLTDTYALEVSDTGHLAATLTSTTTNGSSSPPNLDFWGFNGKFQSSVNSWVAQLKATLIDIPVSFAQDFAFPGGQTFSFLDVAFSTNLDLVSHITYR